MGIWTINYKMASFFFGCMLMLSLFFAPKLHAQAIVPLSHNDSVKIANWTRLCAEQERKQEYREASNYIDKVALLYWEHNYANQAIEHYKHSIRLNEPINNLSGISMLNNNIAMLYADLEDYQHSYEHFRKTLAYRKSQNEKFGIISAQLNLSVVLNHLGRFSESIVGLEEAARLSQEMNDINQMKSCYGWLSEAYLKAGDNAKSIEYYDKYRILADKIQKQRERENQEKLEEAKNTITSIEKEKKSKDVQLIQKNHELAVVYGDRDTLQKYLSKRQLQIELYKKEKELRDIKDTREKETLKAQIAKQKVRYIFIFTFIACLILFIILAIRSNLNKNRYAKQLEEQHRQIMHKNDEILIQRDMLEKANQEISLKNMDITSSINYALKIQQAMMAPQLRLSRMLPNSFVFYQPRDIISGDFYWYTELDQDQILLTVVDCTGHGVPGAFMSMLGFSIIRQVVEYEGIYSPKHVLEILDRRVYKSLNQEISENNDGMEAAIILVNKKEKTIQFSGAGLPILYFQEGKMFYVKGEARAIGGNRLHSDRKFTNHTIELNSDTSFYLFSDGYVDQFGSMSDKKFLIKKFRELLFSIQKKSMEEQKTILSNVFEEWKGNQKQTDDILVFGAKIQV